MADQALDLLRSILGNCIDHRHEQVGRCVYCRTCGRRLYQGTVMTPADLAELREALAAGDPANVVVPGCTDEDCGGECDA